MDPLQTVRCRAFQFIWFDAFRTTGMTSTSLKTARGYILFNLASAFNRMDQLFGDASTSRMSVMVPYFPVSCFDPDDGGSLLHSLKGNHLAFYTGRSWELIVKTLFVPIF